MHESESEVAQLCLTLSDPTDCSPPGSSIHAISQARVLEWAAIAFSQRYHYIPLKEAAFKWRPKLEISFKHNWQDTFSLEQLNNPFEKYELNNPF